MTTVSNVQSNILNINILVCNTVNRSVELNFKTDKRLQIEPELDFQTIEAGLKITVANVMNFL